MIGEGINYFPNGNVATSHIPIVPSPSRERPADPQQTGESAAATPDATGGRMKLRYMGFAHQTTDIRQYIFQGIILGGPRKGLLVTTDVALLTKHHIQIQEVPLMCLRLLESAAEMEPQLEFVLTEADMLAHIRAKEAAKEQAKSKGTKRSLNPENPEALGVAPRSWQKV